MALTFDTQNESYLKAAQAACFDPSSTSGWVLLYYTGPSTLSFEASGGGGTEEVAEYLTDDQIQYASSFLCTFCFVQLYDIPTSPRCNTVKIKPFRFPIENHFFPT